jgi:hypothetical protein
LRPAIANREDFLSIYVKVSSIIYFYAVQFRIYDQAAPGRGRGSTSSRDLVFSFSSPSLAQEREATKLRRECVFNETHGAIARDSPRHRNANLWRIKGRPHPEEAALRPRSELVPSDFVRAGKLHDGLFAGHISLVYQRPR